MMNSYFQRERLKNKVKKLFIFLFLMNPFLPAFSYAESATTTLTQRLAHIQSMQADFTQTITEKTNKPLQQSTGRMELQRPGKFRWEVKKPIPQLIIANTKQIWIYDPELEQVTIRSINTLAGDTPVLLLSDSTVSLAKNFHVRLKARSDTHLQWFLLTPRNKNSMIASLQLGFKNNQIHEMELQDHLGHRTLIHFSNIVINQSLAVSSFTFHLPAHVDVIDETKR